MASLGLDRTLEKWSSGTGDSLLARFLLLDKLADITQSKRQLVAQALAAFTMHVLTTRNRLVAA